MSIERRLQIVKDYMQTIRAAAGNDEFLALLTERYTTDDRPLCHLDQMTVGELHELFGNWITEHDE